ncbi:Putative pentatricopeptide repeat-containing protein At5g52630 [Dionaea muscipula]
MLHRLHQQPPGPPQYDHCSPLNHSLPSSLSKPPQNAFNQSSFEGSYRHICSVLVSLTRSRSLSKGLQLHSLIIKSSLQSISLVAHHLINFYSKCQLPLLSRQIFDEFPFKSATTWSSVISSFAQNELPVLALEFFRCMVGDGVVRPDDHIYPSAIKACATLSRVDVGRSIHGMVVNSGYDSDVFVGSSMVDMYAKCGEIWDARKMFEEMPVKNVVSWSGMIYGYAQLGQNEEALGLFKMALEEGLDVNDFTFSSVVHVCGSSTLLELGKQVHALSVKLSYDSSSFVGSSLISLYSKCGVIEEAHRVFDAMQIKNLGMWNAMLIAYAQHAHTSKVLNLFSRMGHVGMYPNFITFLSVLYACSHAGLVEEGKYYFGLMKTYGIQPRPQHYSSFVDLLGRAGKLQEALKVVEEMPMEPTESVWGALLTGCRLHKNTELASYVADRVFELGPVSSGIYVLLSNAYAAAGRFEEAAKARKMLRDAGLKKETGLSWVEEGSRIHTFAVGEKRHPKWEEIYRKLEELGEEMERAGYVADTSFVLQQVDGDEKNQSNQVS